MRDYRHLTEEEIRVLENNVCWAEDWSRVMVDEAFRPYNFHRVMFYGDIRLGKFEKMVGWPRALRSTRASTTPH